MESISELEHMEYGWQPPLTNQIDYIPLVSTIWGIARIAFGILKIVFGSLLFPFEVLKGIFFAGYHKFTIVSGLQNIFRGFVALHPVGGNLILYFYDRSTFFRN